MFLVDFKPLNWLYFECSSPAQELRLWHDQIQYKPAQKGGLFMWHQDAPYWPIIEPATQATAWIALDDVDEENGCMSMVPGSHLWGNELVYLKTLEGYTAIPESYKGHDIQVVTCPVKKGHVHFHHSLTWHGSQANVSGRPRRAIALHYMTEETCYVAANDHAVKDLVEVADGEILQGKKFPLVFPSQ
jgi:phytanoyl-CoA hydroxylase